MNELDDKTGKTDKSLKSFSSSAKGAGKVIAGAGAAILAAGSALSTMIVATAMSRRELELFSKQAKLSVENFNALSFATKQYGVNAEQIADISKDISDKLGEFAKAGTGPFQDFIDVMGMTKEEGQVLAIQMQDLSSDQVIGMLVDRMEDAGASGNEMTFVMESLGNDLSKLIPLFSANSAELKSLESSYKAATKEMSITEEQAKDLEEAAKSFDLLMASLGEAATNIAANIAPSINNFFQGVISSVPEATKAINEFLDKIEHPSMRKKYNVAQTGTIQRDSSGKVTGSTDTTNIAATAESEKVEAVKTGEEILAEVRENARILEKEAFDTANASALAAIEDRFKTETELLQEKLEADLAVVGEDRELQLQLTSEHERALSDIKIEEEQRVKDAKEKIARASERAASKEASADRKALNQKQRDNDSLLASAKTLNSALLDDNKAIGAGIIVADTAIAITRALAELGPVAGPVAAAAIATTGALQLANLNSATRGGGATSAPGIIPSEVPDQGDNSELLISQSDSDGANQSVIIRFEGNGDEITEALAKNMVVLQRNGTIEA